MLRAEPLVQELCRPVKAKKKHLDVETVAITAEMQDYSAYQAVRTARSEARNVGSLQVRKEMLLAKKETALKCKKKK